MFIFFFNTVNKSECIKHVVFDCALNVSSWNVAPSNERKKNNKQTHLFMKHFRDFALILLEKI